MPQTTHTVVDGDTLWDLAKQYLGKGSRWHEIWYANIDILGNDPDTLRTDPPMVLVIPAA